MRTRTEHVTPGHNVKILFLRTENCLASKLTFRGPYDLFSISHRDRRSVLLPVATHPGTTGGGGGGQHNHLQPRIQVSLLGMETPNFKKFVSKGKDFDLQVHISEGKSCCFWREGTATDTHVERLQWRLGGNSFCLNTEGFFSSNAE